MNKKYLLLALAIAVPVIFIISSGSKAHTSCKGCGNYTIYENPEHTYSIRE